MGKYMDADDYDVLNYLLVARKNPSKERIIESTTGSLRLITVGIAARSDSPGRWLLDPRRRTKLEENVGAILGAEREQCALSIWRKVFCLDDRPLLGRATML